MRKKKSTAKSETAPTPGPWKAVVVRPAWVEIAGPNGEDIGSVNASDGTDEPTLYPYEANARLMAAAPDLLAALKQSVADAAPATNPSSRMPNYEDAVAAIAKAEGGK